MSVRTYGRRSNGSRGGIISYSDNDDLNDAVHDSADDQNDNDTPSQQDHHLYGLPFSSQESSSHFSAFDFDSFGLEDDASPALNGVVPKPKKPRVSAAKRDFPPPLPFRDRDSSRPPPSIPATATLMEAQEFGEMMEHVDEVNFALDGLRRNQPVRIRRASLLSLLSICGTPQQRRLLRTQGMAKTIIDAVLGLSFDDSPSNLASAALLYALTSDGQDEHLLESPNCIKFLIRLLKPMVSTAGEEKVPKIGCKLLALRTGFGILKTSNKEDSSAAAILSKVYEILLSCKELKSSFGNTGLRKQKLCPKWIALLTIEKACLSTISLEETSGTVRKTGGIFKEKLRELGGLDAVFEVAMNCHSDMESWMEMILPLTRDAKVNMDMQCLSLLLKCLRIMENATFLSTDNQNHLLGMKRKMTSTGSPLSFTQLVISIIKILSDLSLLKTSAVASTNEKFSALSEGTSYSFEFDFEGDTNENILSISSKSNSEKINLQKSFTKFQNGQFVSSGRLECTSSETTSTSMTDSYSLKTRLRSSASSSCSGTSKNLSGSMPATKNGSRKNLGVVQEFDNLEGAKLELLDDGQDPFAFDEDDLEPSKWEVLSGKQNIPRTTRIGQRDREPAYQFQSQTLVSHEETSNGEDNLLREASCSTSVGEEGCNLLADCLLTAVKALMNVTNDNPVGCQQIAASGGLETMSSLIALHFPSFSSSSPSSVDLDNKNDRPLTDHELDFLVAILGLLVNLVEKDGENRSRLASASVQLHNSDLFDEASSKDVISLLCSIFLANQGAGEAVHEGKASPWDDEEVVLQGEKEAEKMILEAYAALLLAFLSSESKSIRDAIAECLPDRNLAILVPVLDRFVAFHLSLNMITPETHKAVSEVIESCRGG